MIVNGKIYSEEIRLLEKLISIAKGNGFETLKICSENLSKHEIYICKKKGFGKKPLLIKELYFTNISKT